MSLPGSPVLLGQAGFTDSAGVSVVEGRIVNSSHLCQGMQGL